MLKNDARLSLIRSWLTRDLGWRVGRISVASADASFRRYFRVSRGDVDPAAWAPRADTLIVMDAPPGKEDVAPYLKVSSLLEQAGAHVPHVHASDSKRGFIVMEDLGDIQYLSRLKTGRGVDKLYGEALTTLANIQVRGLRAASALPPYDRAPLERELNLMPEWFLRKHLGLELSPEERALLTVSFEFLINEALLQPQVFVHRDFHSRNLMVLPNDNKGGPGVIDFQDALCGPIGYDLVSLLKDCYISWSRERVERWVRGYRRVLGNLGANVGDSEYQFMRWFDLIGVQRHLKVLGIFARLWHRDGKIGYLADLPLTLEYVRDACRRYPELVEFERWLAWRVEPQLAPATARQKVKPPRVASRRKPKPKPKSKRKSAGIKKKAVAAKKKLKRVLRKVRAARKTRKAKRVIKRSVKRVIKRVKRGGRKLTARRRRTRRLHK
ncbi:MAG TPA: phosphotransferase [Steroidobacteraceae bacterium]|nr:phosphotransferase [Steroidobacteraceae bacterium]